VNRPYNPEIPPDPELWLASGEMERMVLVNEFHQKAGLSLGSHKRDGVHATFHVMAENQLATIDEPELATIRRKVAYMISKLGLTRHEAIHKLGMHISGQIHIGMRKAEGLSILGTVHHLVI